MIKLIISSILYFSFCTIANGQFKGPEFVPIAAKGKLDTNSINKLSSIHLKLIRNEVFAHHGYKFKSREMKLHFGSCQWYQPRFENVNHLLNETEKYNVSFIKKFEETGFLDIQKLSSTINLDSINTDGNYSEINLTTSVAFEKVQTSGKWYLIQKIKEIVSYPVDMAVDGLAYNMRTLNIFEINEDSQLKFYKMLKVNEGKVKVESIRNRLYYKSEAYPIGTGITIYKLVDIKDGFPFVISKYRDQKFRINTKESTRWISYYEYAQDDWIYDQNIDFIEKSGVRYNRLGSIIYSDLDNIYQILDIYRPYSQIQDIWDSTQKLGIEVVPNDGVDRFLSENKNEIMVNNYSDCKVIFKMLGNSYNFSVAGSKFNIENFKDQGDNIFLKIRDCENY